MSTEVRMQPIRDPEYCDVMTLEDFKQDVKCGVFTDYDGFGYLATETEESNISIYPSDIKKGKKIDPQFTHIVWFNK